MTAVLIFTALLCLFSLPLYGYFYISPKIQNPQTAETVPDLCLLPSFALFGLAMYLEQPKPLTLSSACGTVQRYTVQKNRHSKSFERIAVQLDSSRYVRHFSYEAGLPRFSARQRICFDYYDRQRNPQLAESKIIKITH